MNVDHLPPLLNLSNAARILGVTVGRMRGLVHLSRRSNHIRQRPAALTREQAHDPPSLPAT
jgi:hypothetical protein